GPAAKRGFIAWDPAQVGSPPGEKDATSLPMEVKNLVSLGEGGCPYEMPLEGMYRFLIDPQPYAKINVVQCGDGPGGERCAVQMGIDDDLLAQRKSFLRYDSLVAVIVLTDENDCSLTAGGLSYHVFDDIGTVPRATAECAANPNDACCRSCDDPIPRGCPTTDTECAKGPYSSSEDSGLLRCYDQKQRYGRDYLYPTGRYVAGLTGKMVKDQSGKLVQNPLFEDPTGQSPRRDPSLVFFAAIVGVPWQDLAENPRDPIHLTLKSADEMQRDGTWNLVLSNPAT